MSAAEIRKAIKDHQYWRIHSGESYAFRVPYDRQSMYEHG